MSKISRAGTAALLAGPLLALLINAEQPTLSDDPAAQVNAFTSHHVGMMIGLDVGPLSIVLVMAGIVWLATALSRWSPKLATAGGITGVAGGLVILFEDGVHAVTPTIAGTLGTSGATSLLNAVHASGAARIEPLALLLDVGLALLAFAAVKAGAPVWLAVALTVCAFAEGFGEATGSRPVLLVAFAGLFLTLAGVVRVVTGSTATRPMHQTAHVADSHA